MRPKAQALLLCSFFSIAFGAGASAQLSRPLTLDQVHCEEDRLTSLLSRTQFLSAQAAKPIAMTWTLGNAEGDFSGLALSTQFPVPARPFDFEKQLWVDLHSAASLLRDPAAARRPTVTLVRNDLLTDLLPAADPERLTVKVDATGSPVPRPGDFAAVDNLRSGAEASTKRGLKAFPTPCGSPLSAADLHVFRVLAKVVRGLYYNEGGSSSDSPKYRQRALIYRGAEAVPLLSGGMRVAYRIDVIDDEIGRPDRFSAELEIDLGADGTLGAAVLHRLPLCSTVGERDCSSAANGGGLATIEIVRPVPPGVFAPSAAFLCFFPNFDGTDLEPCTPTETTFDFATILAGTDWGRP